MQYVAIALMVVALAAGKTVDYGSVFVPNVLLLCCALLALCIHVIFGI